MKKPIVIGTGKKSFLDVQKGYIAGLIHNLKDFSKLFMKKNGRGGMISRLSLNNIEDIYDHIVQIYYNGYRIKKFGEDWIYTEDAPREGRKAQQQVKFESSGNLSVRIQDGAHQKMLCFSIDSKLRLHDTRKF
ncbi:MAG: hypothetical protein JW928_00675 [Candidatus Aureabacteria bacterium]|nr:hypothetical protein [Candidatus Auribacterota bacterium]